MGKTVFMFPGQGAQYIGMGKEFYEKYPSAKAAYDLAGEVTGLDVAALCFEEDESIRRSQCLQPRLQFGRYSMMPESRQI